MLLDLRSTLGRPQHVGWKWVPEPPSLHRSGRSRLRFHLVIVSSGAILHKDPAPVAVRHGIAAAGGLVSATSHTNLHFEAHQTAMAQIGSTILLSVEVIHPDAIRAAAVAVVDTFRSRGHGNAFDPDEWLILDDPEFS